MATQPTALVTPQHPLTTTQQALKQVPRTAAEQKNTNFEQFRANLAMLHLLPAEELERRWLKVQKKNEDKLAQGISVNPYDR